MSLDQGAAPSGLGIVSATQEGTASEGDNGYEGFSSPDELESADQPATPEEEQGTQPEGEEEAQAEPDQWEGYEDYEIDGVIKKVPSEWKENLMLKADHTRRLQELAESRKQVQARETELTQRFQRTEEEYNSHLELAMVRNQLKPAEGINWNAEYQRIMNDPKKDSDYLAWDMDLKQFQSVYMQFQELKNRESALQQTADNLAKQRIEAGEQETLKRLSKTLDFAQKNIKGWTPELDQKITDFAMGEGGYDAETLRNGMTPQNYKILHLAYLGHQSLIRQQTAKPNSTLQKPLLPTQSVSAKANVQPSFDPDRSSMEDYAKDWKRRQEKRKR